MPETQSWPARDQRYAEMYAKLDALLKYDGRCLEISKQMARVRNAGHSLLAFMKYEFVDSTDNPVERELHEVVKHSIVNCFCALWGRRRYFPYCRLL